MAQEPLLLTTVVSPGETSPSRPRPRPRPRRGGVRGGGARMLVKGRQRSAGSPYGTSVAQEHQGCGVRVPLPIEPHSAKSIWLVSSIVVVFRLSCCCSNKRGAPASPMFPLRPKFRHRSQAQPSGWPLTTIPPCLDCARPRAPPEAK